MENQKKLLKKYGVSNYTVENDKITINGSLYLRSLILTRCRHYCTLNDTNCHCGIPVADFIKSVLN